MTSLQIALVHAEEILQNPRKYVIITQDNAGTKLDYGYIMTNGERDRIIGTRRYYETDEAIEYSTQIHA